MVLLDDLALTLSLLGFVFGLVLGILYNFPWIFKYYKPIFVEYRKQADDKILIISDLHMHPEKCTFQFLENILKQHGITTVVIAGDFLEFHKKINKDKAKELVEECFSKFPESSVKNILITLSHASHDPIIDKEMVFSYNSLEIRLIPGFVKIISERYSVYVSHGDYFCRNGAVAGVLNKMSSVFGKPLVSERILKKIIKARDDEWIISGHTHIAGIDESARVANPGAWHKHIGRDATRTGIILDNAGPKMIKLQK